jgi:hypothetical protein
VLTLSSEVNECTPLLVAAAAKRAVVVSDAARAACVAATTADDAHGRAVQVDPINHTHIESVWT